jgi:hypothetical protein
MKFTASVLLTIIFIISGCHSKTSNDKSSSQSNLDTLSTGSIDESHVLKQEIHGGQTKEIMIAQNQGDANRPPTVPDANEPNTPPADEPQNEPAGSIQINMTAWMTFEPADVSVILGQPVSWVNCSEMI